MRGTNDAGPREDERPCPECGRPAKGGHLPFCSARCRNVDLNRWLSGGYAIPGEPAGADAIPDHGDESDSGGSPPTRRH